MLLHNRDKLSNGMYQVLLKSYSDGMSQWIASVKVHP